MNKVLLKDYKKSDFTIPNIELFFNIEDDYATVESLLTIKKDSLNSQAPLILDGYELEILEIKLNENDVEYSYLNNKLTIDRVPENFTLYTKVKIDPYKNKSLEGFYKSGDILCTQNEAEGFRRITFFMDRPDIMSKYKISIEADKNKYPVLLGNGNLIDSVNLGNNRHRAVWEDPFPKPCYLMAIVAGKLDKITDSFTTMSGRKIKLEIYTDPGKSAYAQHAMNSLKKSMKWDEDNFGLEYDLDIYMIVAVDSFNAGAMENKGLNIFNSVYVLADPETATDNDFELIEAVIAHEYFHNWTGNRVTCRDWFQLTLKEGLTVFRDQEFTSDMTDRSVKRIKDAITLRDYQFPEDKGPNSHPIKPESYMKIDNFYTATVYEKGAEVIRMIHTLIGKDNFRKGMDLYFKRHTGNAVTTEDFVSAMADASGYNLDQFKLWYSQAGTPIVNIESEYSEGNFTLKISQEIPETSYNGGREPQYFPLNLSLYNKKGHDVTPGGFKQIIIKNKYQEFKIPAGEEVIPSVFQNFSAPVIVNYNYSTDDLIHLLSNDSDNFNKFDAASRVSMAGIEQILLDLKNGNDSVIDRRVTEAYKKLLSDNSLEKSFMAELLYIPEVKNIVNTMEVYDYDLADRARKRYLQLFINELKPSLSKIFEDNVRDKYQFNKLAVSERKLKNRALILLSSLGDDIAEIALHQFRTADNMSDYIAAFTALQQCSDDIRIMANREFYAKWKDNFLVMNKWFSIQANRNSSDVLNEVKELSSNNIFDINNPNRIRSLFGTFAKVNIQNFHRIDGEGYRYITDKIIEIDTFNSHASSQLAAAYQTYKYISDSLAETMKIQLERVLKSDGISTGLYEIVSKTLKARD